MNNQPSFTFHTSENTISLVLQGRWRLGDDLPDADALFTQIVQQHISEIHLNTDQVTDWDTSLLVFLVRVIEFARGHACTVHEEALPQGLQNLLKLAFAVPPKKGAQRTHASMGFLASVGEFVASLPQMVYSCAAFLGDISLSLLRFFTARADIRACDVFFAMQECGMAALPIISITSLLFGLILAFVGAVQLTQFGAEIYVAGLVGIGVLRVMGAIMVGIVMSGRMGAAYAAYIGTMQVNEEIDAMETLGMSPTDFLLLPRVIALTCMSPFLTLYADFMGLFGGFLVGMTLLDIHPWEYVNATIEMVDFSHLLIGLVYGTVFGVIIALCGCYHGIRCGRSAAAVGKATTSAVVHSIVWIIIATAIITILCNILEI